MKQVFDFKIGAHPRCLFKKKPILVNATLNIFGHSAAIRCEVVDNVLCIEDAMGDISITFDAYHIVEKLISKGIDPSINVVYKDTIGVWDQILVKNGRFAGFAYLGASNREAAIKKVERRRCAPRNLENQGK